MARIINITSPYEKTDPILHKLKELDTLFELKVYRKVSVQPPGDVIVLAIPNSDLQPLMRLLDAFDLGKQNGISLSSSEPDSLVPTQSAYPIERDSNESSWEEMEMTISNDSNTSINTLLIMLISGVLATIGIINNSLHIVIGGMLVAPGFMPITRIALGIISRQRGWLYGIFDTLKGYLALLTGAAITTLFYLSIDQNPLSGSSSYYQTQQQLIEYWTTITISSLLASAAASIAGALLIATKKSVFTSGVMIGLALVPSAAIISMSMVTGDFELAGKAVLRFALDVGLVLVLSLIVLLWERMTIHKRDARLM